MQACLYEHLFYEWTIWRMPYSEEKRSEFELAFRLISYCTGMEQFLKEKGIEVNNSVGIILYIKSNSGTMRA